MKRHAYILISLILFACSEKEHSQPLTADQTATEVMTALKNKDYERMMPFVVDMALLMDRQVPIAKKLLNSKDGQVMLKRMGKSRDEALADLERIVQSREGRSEEYQLGYEQKLHEDFKVIAEELQAPEAKNLKADIRTIIDSQLVAELPLVEARREYRYPVGQNSLIINLVSIDKNWYVKNLALE